MPKFGNVSTTPWESPPVPAPQVPPGMLVTRREPMHYIGPGEAAGWAALFGGCLAVGAGLIIFRTAGDFEAAVIIAISVFLAAFGIVLFVIFGMRHDMIFKIEEITGKDINGDGEAGEPSHTTLTIQVVDQTRPDRGHMLRATIPVADWQLMPLARLALAGNLSDRKVNQSIGLGKKRWDKVRDALLAARLVTWVDESDHNKGVAATDIGKLAFDQYATGHYVEE